MEKSLAVLFDLDGVLVNTYEAWFQLVNATARTFQQADVERKQFEKSWGQGITADLEQFFPGCAAADIQEFYEQHLLDYDSCIEISPGANKTLKALRLAQTPVAVVTNTPTKLARDILAWAGLIGMIDVTVGASPEMQPKPAPDIVLAACDTLAVEPEKALVLGDSRFDAQAAEAAKARFVGYRTEKGQSISHLSEVLELVGPHTST